MPHEDLINHFDKDLDAEVILLLNIHKFYLDCFLRSKLFAILLNLNMQAPNVENQSEIYYLKFMQVVLTCYIFNGLKN